MMKRSFEPSHAHRIGIVEDDEAVRDAIHSLLETKGFLVSPYDSAQHYLRDPQEDCALLIDLSMSGLDGMDLVELLRSGGVRTPIILMTDIARPLQAQRISAAADCVMLRKPVDSASLLTAIASSMRSGACAFPST